MVITPTYLSPSCIVCRGVGTLDHDAFIELFEELFRIRGPLGGICLYGDLTGCRSTLDFDQEFRIVDYVRAHLPLMSGSKWAFVTDSLLIYGLARMGQILTSDFPFRYAVFNDPDQAITWLGCPELLQPAVDILAGIPS